jgi:hypothetical protein
MARVLWGRGDTFASVLVEWGGSLGRIHLMNNLNGGSECPQGLKPRILGAIYCRS